MYQFGNPPHFLSLIWVISPQLQVRLPRLSLIQSCSKSKAPFENGQTTGPAGKNSYWFCSFRVKWVTEWFTEWVSEWVIHWVSEWVSEWFTEWVSEWFTEWVIHWLSDSLSEWVSDSMSEWVIHCTTTLYISTMHPTVHQDLSYGEIFAGRTLQLLCILMSK